VTVEQEIAEAVAEVLTRTVPAGVVLKPEADARITVLAYLRVDEELDARIQELEENLGHLDQIWPIPAPTYERIPDQDWTLRWKETVPVLPIGERLVIKPSWRTYTPATSAEVVVDIDPGQAFGLGVHPTTQLCLRELERRIRPDMRILDLGTGSGILAIAAAKLARVDVWAVDHDAGAVSIAQKNLHLNEVAERVHLHHGSLRDVEGVFDLILANLLTPIVVRMLDTGLALRLSPQGLLIASGILEEQVAEVVTACEAHALTIEKIARQEDWVAVVAKRRP